jgi:AcrR family transcriptional regulator
MTDRTEPQGRPSESISPRLGRLVEDLENVFLAEGFLHFSTEELAARLRCSKRTLYMLAPSREALFELVIERFLSKIRERGEATAQRAKNFVETVTGYLNVAVEATRRAGQKFVRDLAVFPAGHQRLMRHQRERIAGLERLIEAGRAHGAFRDVHPKLVAEVLLLAVARMADPDFLASVDLSMSKAFEELYKIFSYGIISQDERDGSERSQRRSRQLARTGHARMRARGQRTLR